MLSDKDTEALARAHCWFKEGEVEGSLIIFEALWKKHPHHFEILLGYSDAQEKINPLKVLDFYSEILMAEGAWLNFLQNITDAQRAQIFERHGLLAYSLKDEISALDSLRRAASIGLDTLNMWAVLALLFSVNSEAQLGLKAFFRTVSLYTEPTFFCHEKTYPGIRINDDIFWTIALNLVPQLAKKDAIKVSAILECHFSHRPWLPEIQRIVAQVIDDVPIKGSGESYVGIDAKNR